MWLLIWACLLVVAGVYLGSRARALWGQTKELGSELGLAQRRLDDVQDQMEMLGATAPREPLRSIISSPHCRPLQERQGRPPSPHLPPC